MKEDALSNADIVLIDNFNRHWEEAFEAIERSKRYKLGDYLVLFLWNYNGVKSQKVNSYGAPVKYKVVHVTARSMPFIKQVDVKGKPIGQVFTIMGLDGDDYRGHAQKYEFELDPDFADSIILEDEYDPATLHKSKKDIWKAVTAHNKSCKIQANGNETLIEFFKTVNVGDMLWTSTLSHYLVQDKRIMTVTTFNATVKSPYRTNQKYNPLVVLTLIDKKGKIINVAADFFLYKALYKERPRSYKELNI